jgi:hypothetical protein
MYGNQKKQTIGHRGVFCLEGAWSADLSVRTTVRPLLDMLEAIGSCSYIHRDVHTIDELQQLLKKWTQKQLQHWSVLHLAMHGTNQTLHLGGKITVSLDELGAMLKGKCAGRVIYIASCSVAKNKAALDSFRRQTKADYVLGYTKSVDWITSAAFELALLHALAHYSKVGDALNYIEKKDPHSLAQGLGFRRLPTAGCN